MNEVGLNRRLVDAWRMAANDLGIRVTAPMLLQDSNGEMFACEVFIEDFGSPRGALIVGQKTERRVRENLRNIADRPWVSIEPDKQPSTYNRKRHIDCLRDFGWFGDLDQEPSWYSDCT